MPTLTLILKHGFEGEPVVVRMNGKVVYRKEDVRTRFQIDRADAFETEVPQAEIPIEIDLPFRGMTQSLAIKVDGDVTAAVSVEPSGISIHTTVAATGDL